MKENRSIYRFFNVGGNKMKKLQKEFEQCGPVFRVVLLFQMPLHRGSKVTVLKLTRAASVVLPQTFLLGRAVLAVLPLRQIFPCQAACRSVKILRVQLLAVWTEIDIPCFIIGEIGSFEFCLRPVMRSIGNNAEIDPHNL